jgi:DNA polymerase III subunit delta'
MISFENVIENESLKTSLITQVKSDKLHHAHLFVGKMGMGTLPMAMAFLKYIYCSDRKTNDSCGSCSNCVKIEKLSHIDIHFTMPSFKIDKLSGELMEDFRAIYSEKSGIFDSKDWMDHHGQYNATIRAKEISDILNNMSMTAHGNGYKTQVIWMVEEMGLESNKILKILEEPNSETIFILIAESMERLLPTIISRCNIHRMESISDTFIDNYVREHRSKASEDILVNAVRFANGDLIEAIRYIDDFDSEFSLEQALRKFMRGLTKFETRKFQNINFMLESCEDLAGQNKQLQVKFLEFMLYFVHQLMRYKTTRTCSASEVLMAVIQHYESIVELDQIEAWMKIVDNNIRAVYGNANMKISFVSLGIELGRILNRKEFEMISTKL